MKAVVASVACEDCPLRVVCRCLQVTEDEIIDAIQAEEIRTLHDVRRFTGAGDGCTACHARIMECLDEHGYPSSSSPICSVK